MGNVSNPTTSSYSSRNSNIPGQPNEHECAVSAGNDSPKKSQSASQSNRSTAQSKSTAMMKLEPDVLFTELVQPRSPFYSVFTTDLTHVQHNGHGDNYVEGWTV